MRGREKTNQQPKCIILAKQPGRLIGKRWKLEIGQHWTM